MRVRIWWQPADMAKTLVDVNEEYLAAAQEVLHTETKKDTINAALHAVAALAARRRDLQRLASGGLPDLADAALEHVANAELTADLLHVDRPPLVGEGRIARDHEQPTDARERGDDVFHHSVGEIILFRVAAHVLERQHRDRRPVR